MRGLQTKTMELVEDRQEHTIQILQDVGVPEPEHDVAHGFELGGASRIPSNRPVKAVLSAVDLNYEMMLKTGEIDDESVDGRLPFELQSIDLPPGERCPESPFGVGCIVA